MLSVMLLILRLRHVTIMSQSFHDSAIFRSSKPRFFWNPGSSLNVSASDTAQDVSRTRRGQIRGHSSHLAPATIVREGVERFEHSQFFTFRNKLTLPLPRRMLPTLSRLLVPLRSYTPVWVSHGRPDHISLQDPRENR